LDKSAVAQAFSYTFFSVAAIGVLQIFILLRLKSSDGENMSHRN
jgi:hypothetical protein